MFHVFLRSNRIGMEQMQPARRNKGGTTTFAGHGINLFATRNNKAQRSGQRASLIMS
jgi:hypothetical protein